MRQPSTTSSVPAPQRAKSDEQQELRSDSDPYFPRTRANKDPALPASDEWVFRIAFISSTADLDHDLFKKAVQGLVKICFPQSVLEELGIDVVTQHMQEEHAPRQNVNKMKEVFRTEMIHRIAWMLAEYLDTPSKVKTGIHSTIAASRHLHGNKWTGNFLEDMMAKFKELQSDITGDNEGIGLVSLDEEPVPSSAKLKKKRDRKRPYKKRNRLGDDGNHTESLSDLDDFGEQALATENPCPSPLRKIEDKEKHISSTWRWNIEPSDISSAKVAEVFKRTSDLFAYHALPIAKSVLDPKARRKVMRYRIQTMMDQLTEDQYKKWVNSLAKLHAGDRTMLVRGEPDVASQRGKLGVATLAPIDMQRRSGNAGDERLDTRVPNSKEVETDRELSLHQPYIKHEINTDVNIIEEAPRNFSPTTSALGCPWREGLMNLHSHGSRDELNQVLHRKQQVRRVFLHLKRWTNTETDMPIKYNVPP